MEVGLSGEGISSRNGSSGETHAQHAAANDLSGGLAGGVTGGGGFLGFLQTYPNPFLTRFGFSGEAATRLGEGGRLGEVDSLEGEKETDKTTSKEGAISGGSYSDDTDDTAAITITIDDGPVAANG